MPLLRLLLECCFPSAEEVAGLIKDDEEDEDDVDGEQQGAHR